MASTASCLHYKLAKRTTYATRSWRVLATSTRVPPAADFKKLVGLLSGVGTITLNDPELKESAAKLAHTGPHSSTGTLANGGLPNAAAAVKGKKGGRNSHSFLGEGNTWARASFANLFPAPERICL